MQLDAAAMLASVLDSFLPASWRLLEVVGSWQLDAAAVLGVAGDLIGASCWCHEIVASWQLDVAAMATAERSTPRCADLRRAELIHLQLAHECLLALDVRQHAHSGSQRYLSALHGMQPKSCRCWNQHYWAFGCLASLHQQFCGRTLAVHCLKTQEMKAEVAAWEGRPG